MENKMLNISNGYQEWKIKHMLKMQWGWSTRITFVTSISYLHINTRQVDMASQQPCYCLIKWRFWQESIIMGVIKFNNMLWHFLVKIKSITNIFPQFFKEYNFIIRVIFLSKPAKFGGRVRFKKIYKFNILRLLVKI
jgi:hypothetical protein